MSFNSPKLDFTVEASADLSAEQFRAVVVGASGAAVAGADADILGILQNNPDAAGQACVVQNKGVAQAQVGGVVTRGARLSSDGSGDLVSGGGNAIATALEAGSGAGSVIAVLLD